MFRIGLGWFITGAAVGYLIICLGIFFLQEWKAKRNIDEYKEEVKKQWNL